MAWRVVVFESILHHNPFSSMIRATAVRLSSGLRQSMDPPLIAKTHPSSQKNRRSWRNPSAHSGVVHPNFAFMSGGGAVFIGPDPLPWPWNPPSLASYQGGGGNFTDRLRHQPNRAAEPPGGHLAQDHPQQQVAVKKSDLATLTDIFTFKQSGVVSPGAGFMRSCATPAPADFSLPGWRQPTASSRARSSAPGRPTPGDGCPP
jgi:hypothetical protein